MDKTRLLYTVTDDKGNVVIADANAIDAADAIGASRPYLQKCAEQGVKCKQYKVTVKMRELKNGNNLNNDYLVRRSLKEWDKVMYDIRTRYGLDMSHWDDFMLRKDARA